MRFVESAVLDSSRTNDNNDLIYTFANASPSQFQLYWNPSVVIGKFAFDVASTLEKMRVPIFVEYLLTPLVIPAWFVLRRSGSSLLLASAVLSQAAFMAASWMLVGVRHKEEVSILPITLLVYSLVIFALAKLLKKLLMRKRNKMT
jgi:hypothetical protein